MGTVRVYGKALVDTNVLIYATLRDDPRFAVAQKLLRSGTQRSSLYISVQNLAEMYPNLTGSKMAFPDTPGMARQKILSIAALPHLHVLPLTYEIQKKALELSERLGVTRQRFFDMQLAATLLHYRLSTLLTENTTDFQGISGIRAVNPFLSIPLS